MPTAPAESRVSRGRGPLTAPSRAACRHLERTADTVNASFTAARDLGCKAINRIARSERKQHTSTIKFTSLECIRRQDVTGKDEPHSFLDGVDSWNGVVDKKETVPVGLSKNFDGSMSVTLKEKNPNSWKTIGTVTIDTGEVAPAEFKTSGAHYELWFSLS